MLLQIAAAGFLAFLAGALFVNIVAGLLEKDIDK
jgi:hypothetical protein